MQASTKRGALLDSADEFNGSMCGAAVKDDSILGPWCFPGALFECRGSGSGPCGQNFL